MTQKKNKWQTTHTLSLSHYLDTRRRDFSVAHDKRYQMAWHWRTHRHSQAKTVCESKINNYRSSGIAKHTAHNLLVIWSCYRKDRFSPEYSYTPPKLSTDFFCKKTLCNIHDFIRLFYIAQAVGWTVHIVWAALFSFSERIVLYFEERSEVFFEDWIFFCFFFRAEGNFFYSFFLSNKLFQRKKSFPCDAW